jgi:hypothetical protein
MKKDEHLPMSLHSYLDYCNHKELLKLIDKIPDFMINFDPKCMRKSSDEAGRLIYSDVMSELVFDLKMRDGKLFNVVDYLTKYERFRNVLKLVELLNPFGVK